MLTLRDALYNLSPDSGSSHRYARGLIVGIVATLMDVRGWTFEQAISYLLTSNVLPSRIHPKSVPPSWANLFANHIQD
jgi:hypothetical protein